MKITCTNCGATLEGEPRPGVALKCTQCGAPVLFQGMGKSKTLINRRGPAPEDPHKDNYLMPIMAGIAILTVIAASLILDMGLLMIIVWGISAAFCVWLLSLLRVIAYRLQHIERLLAEQNVRSQ